MSPVCPNSSKEVDDNHNNGIIRGREEIKGVFEFEDKRRRESCFERDSLKRSQPIRMYTSDES